MADQQSLVTMALYADPVLASVAKTKLDSEGIFCFLAEEELMNSSLRTVVGEVRLQVKQKDLTQAKKILKIC